MPNVQCVVIHPSQVSRITKTGSEAKTRSDQLASKHEILEDQFHQQAKVGDSSLTACVCFYLTWTYVLVYHVAYGLSTCVLIRLPHVAWQSGSALVL